MENLQSMMRTDQEVSEEFKTITEKFIIDSSALTSSYKPSLVEIEYLGERIIQRTDMTSLNLEKFILTVETGLRLGKLLSNFRIDKLYIEIRSEGELALIREMQKIKKYYFSGSGIGFHAVLYSLAQSLNTFVTKIHFTGNTITDDGLRIFLNVLNVEMAVAKASKYAIRWDGSTDLNALGLEELFECVDDQKLTVFDSSNARANEIEIKNISQANSFLHIQVDYNKIKTDDIKRFLIINENEENLVVVVDESNTECLLLMSMIDIMKNLPMELIIVWLTPFVSGEKANKIMDGLIKTNLDDLTIGIENLTSNVFQMIFDKLKNIKLRNLTIRNIQNLNQFNSQIVVKPFDIPGLTYLCIEECPLDYRLLKEICFKLEHSKLETLALFFVDINTKLAKLLSNSLIGSNITKLTISFCPLVCTDVKIIAEALKDTKITFIDLNANKIRNAGVKAIANIVGKTKLNTLGLNNNEFNTSGAIELLKSVQKTKIVRCYINKYNYVDGSLDAIASVLKDNKILLECIKKGENTKIDEYLERNYNSFKKAKFIISKYQKGSIPCDYKHKEHFEAYESFIDTDILWNDVDDKERIKLNLGNRIANNYLKICGVINNKLEVNSDYSKRQVNFSHLSLEILNNIFSYLSVSDIVD